MFFIKIVKRFWWQLLKVRIFGNFSTTFWPSTGQLSSIFEHNRDSPSPLPLGFPFGFSCFPPSSGGKKKNQHFEIAIRFGNTLNETPLHGLLRCWCTSNFIWFIKIISIPRTVTAIQFESLTNVFHHFGSLRKMASEKIHSHSLRLRSYWPAFGTFGGGWGCSLCRACAVRNKDSRYVGLQRNQDQRFSRDIMNLFKFQFQVELECVGWHEPVFSTNRTYFVCGKSFNECFC